jgi:hypothetical protein
MMPHAPRQKPNQYARGEKILSQKAGAIIAALRQFLRRSSQ